MKLNRLEKTVVFFVVLLALATCVVKAETLTDRQIDQALGWSKKYGRELLQNMLDGKLPFQSVIDATCNKAAQEQNPNNREYRNYVLLLVNDIVKVASEKFATMKEQDGGDETRARIALQQYIDLLH